MGQQPTLRDLIDQYAEARAEYGRLFALATQGTLDDPAIVAASKKWQAISARIGRELWSFAADEVTTTYRQDDAIYVLGEDSSDYYIIELKHCVDTASVPIAPIVD